MADIVTNNGLANITAGWNAYANRARFLQWGEGSGQTATDNAIASAGNTTEARTAGATMQETNTATNDTFRVDGTITALGARAITEVGVFDGAGSGSPPTGGEMCLYGDFVVINMATDDQLTLTIRVTLESA